MGAAGVTRYAAFIDAERLLVIRPQCENDLEMAVGDQRCLIFVAYFVYLAASDGDGAV